MSYDTIQLAKCKGFNSSAIDKTSSSIYQTINHPSIQSYNQAINHLFIHSFIHHSFTLQFSLTELHPTINVYLHAQTAKLTKSNKTHKLLSMYRDQDALYCRHLARSSSGDIISWQNTRPGSVCRKSSSTSTSSRSRAADIVGVSWYASLGSAPDGGSELVGGTLTSLLSSTCAVSVSREDDWETSGACWPSASGRPSVLVISVVL
mmetsp:Transcript_4689/g.9855  ORF Transcript_4689/g.9855 Transcript_4689/m.9855 type:complete len:206 (-) Transcript_4689:1037-1654(-)